MKISKIGARATYHKCITELHQWGYLKYKPSHNPLKGSLIHLFNFGTTTEQVVSQLDGLIPSQVLGPSINSINNKKHLNSLNIDRVDLKFDQPLKEEKKRSVFISPCLNEVKAFFQEKNKTDLNAEKFFNHFESNGWLVGGKSKMKNWQAAARNWILNSEKFNERSSSPSRDKTSKPGNINVNQNKDYSVPL
jgi:hypothetical protein